MEAVTLSGSFVRLEPLDHCHLDGLVRAAAEDPSLYQWSAVPLDRAATTSYTESALALRQAGKVMAFAIVRTGDGAVIGSSRFFDLERWAWPQGHPRHGHPDPDVGEIGYTWLSRSAIRTAANTEAKFLMLSHAFEAWKLLRICLHTDARNQRSRTAMERIGAKFEGILRGHKMAVDFTPRDSARYSITAADWPEVKQSLAEHLHR